MIGCCKWDEYETQVLELAARVTPPGSVYGLPRGGLTLAVCLSHLLNVPLILTEAEIDSLTLVVDDISDTGKQLVALVNRIGFRPQVATLYCTEQTMFKPDVWLRKKTTEWVVFPWEATCTLGTE